MNGVRLIAQYLGANRRDFLLALLCVAAETSLELAIPMLMAQVIDEGIMARNLNVVFADGGLMIVCALAALGLGLLYARYSARVAMGLGANLREAEYAHLQTYSFANLDDFEASSLVTRLTTDVTVIQNAVVSGTRPMMRGPVSLLVGIAYAALMSPDLALVFCVTTPVIAGHARRGAARGAAVPPAPAVDGPAQRHVAGGPLRHTRHQGVRARGPYDRPFRDREHGPGLHRHAHLPHCRAQHADPAGRDVRHLRGDHADRRPRRARIRPRRSARRGRRGAAEHHTVLRHDPREPGMGRPGRRRRADAGGVPSGLC